MLWHGRRRTRLAPSTGTGAELYTIIGQSPRALDRNIAVVGRVIDGMETLSTLPRGTGDLGFYKEEGQRLPIVSARLASEIPAAQRPHYQYRETVSPRFAAWIKGGRIGGTTSSPCRRGCGYLRGASAGSEGPLS